MEYFVPVDDEQVRREKEKARKMRQSQWWKSKRSSGKCYYCGGQFRPTELTMDHMVPIIRGGKTTKGNVVPCCKDCNNKKKHLLPIEWEQFMESLNK